MIDPGTSIASSTFGMAPRFAHATLSMALFAGCAAPADAPRTAVQNVERAAPSAPDVSVDLRSPMHVRWVPATLGASKPTLGVVVTNRGPTSLDVSDLRVHLEALREDVSFRCAKEVGAPLRAREPKTLAAGTSFVFERALDCALPLVGSYAIRVGVTFGRGQWAAPREVRSFTLRVVAAKELEPRKIDPIPGLWGALGSTNVMQSRAGAGKLVVALVNGGRTPLELPRFRLALRVYRVGTPVPCDDAPTELEAPAVLGVGESYREPVEISCLGLGVAGKYDVVGRLQIGDGEPIELGRLRIEVSDDPSRTVPVMPGVSGP